jgi:non-specific serine/threonine protein kinase
VLVHKLVCRGTVEEKIAALIAGKRQLAGEILGGDGGKFLHRARRPELLDFVAMDLARATAEL